MATVTRPQRPIPSRGRWRRRLITALFVGALGCAGVAVGVGLVPSAVPPEALPRSPAAAPVDWAGVVADLDLARDLALREANPAAIANYAAPGSPAAEADSLLMQRLADSELRPSAVLPQVESVQALQVNTGEARLRVLDSLATVAWIGPDGVAAQFQEARDSRPWSVSLRSVDSRWLLWEVAADGTAP